jgi:hypothetical protein
VYPLTNNFPCYNRFSNEENHRTQRGIQWDLTRKLEDLDFADDICLLAQNFKDMTEKLVVLSREAREVGMRIDQAKTKAMRINNENTNTITLEEQKL